MNIGTKIAAILIAAAAIQISPATADDETFDSFFRESGFAPKHFNVSPSDAWAQAPGGAGTLNVVGKNPAIKDEASWFAFQNRYGD